MEKNYRLFKVLREDVNERIIHVSINQDNIERFVITLKLRRSLELRKSQKSQ